MPEFLSIKEAAIRLGIARVTCYKLAERGELPSVKLGGRRLIPASALAALAAAAGV